MESPSFNNWLNWETDSSKIPNKNLTSIEMICRDNKRHIFFSNNNKIRDVPVLVTKTITICDALKATTFRHMNNILVKCDSQLLLIRLRV